MQTASDVIQEKMYQQGRADAIDECIKILEDDNCKCEFVGFDCFPCMAVKMRKLKEENNANRNSND